jgi:UDPglucose 6-dehydrogenase
MHEVYEKFSLCQVAPVFNMSLEEASLVKYGINSYLAAKVLWFNEFYDVVQKNGSNYRSVINALSNDPRIGNSHTQVPGFDGRRGFGGACFPKDTKALAAYSGGTMKTLAAVIEKNNTYREAYELDAREKEQNVNFN